MATNGQPDISSSGAASSSQPASGRLPYRSPPTGLGPPPPLVPGPYRPPGAPPPGPSTTAPRASYSSCPQCTIYVAKIIELDANILAQKEDADDLRTFIANEMETSAHLKRLISGHEAHIDHTEFELENTRTDMAKTNSQNEALNNEIQLLRNNE
eukprot:9294730-Heterocapsa_arctica.AAC.1